MRSRSDVFDLSPIQLDNVVDIAIDNIEWKQSETDQFTLILFLLTIQFQVRRANIFNRIAARIMDVFFRSESAKCLRRRLRKSFVKTFNLRKRVAAQQSQI